MAIVRLDEDSARRIGRWKRERDAADSDSSHHLSFLIGGFVVAVGLMTFLFYDNGPLQTRRTDNEPFLPRIEVSSAPPVASPQTAQPTR